MSGMSGMSWIFVWIIICSIFVLIAYMSTILSPGCGCPEKFTTDFLAISHTISDNVPPYQYASEYGEDFFKGVLGAVVQDEAFSSNDVNVYKNYHTSTYTDEQLLRATNQLLLTVLNNRLPEPDRKYPYNMSRSKIASVKTLQKGKSVKFIATTQHIVHRDSKAYGVSIELKTLHDSAKGSAVITGFKVHGYVSQDRFKLGCVDGHVSLSPWLAPPQQTTAPGFL